MRRLYSFVRLAKLGHNPGFGGRVLFRRWPIVSFFRLPTTQKIGYAVASTSILALSSKDIGQWVKSKTKGWTENDDNEEDNEKKDEDNKEEKQRQTRHDRMMRDASKPTVLRMYSGPYPHTEEIIRYYTHRRDELDEAVIGTTTALNLAIIHGDLVLMTKLIELGANVDYICTPTSHTPLELAIRVGDLEAMKLLLNANADYLKPDESGFNAVMHSIAHDYDMGLEVILDFAARNNTLPQVFASRTQRGMGPMISAVMAKSRACARVLVQYGHSVNEKGIDQITPLHISAIEGDSKMNIFLLSHGGICTPDAGGKRPEELAILSASNDYITCVQQFNCATRRETTPSSRAIPLPSQPKTS